MVSMEWLSTAGSQSLRLAYRVRKGIAMEVTLLSA
jgi:hypothetical protein